MPIFVCDECNSEDNTALGHYWTRNTTKWKDKNKNNKALCTECMPNEYSDGSKNKTHGKWHNKFPKRQWDGIRKVINR